MADHDLTVHPLEGYPRELGAALWMMADTRSRTLRAVSGLRSKHLDATPTGGENSIGSLLYHLAAIEADWLYADILGQTYPDWMAQLFPHDVRTDDGRLTPVERSSLVEHLDRLATVRRHLLDDLRGLTVESFRLPRETESGTTTPEWVLHHLGQHEAEHRGQIQTIRKAFETSG